MPLIESRRMHVERIGRSFPMRHRGRHPSRLAAGISSLGVVENDREFDQLHSVRYPHLAPAALSRSGIPPGISRALRSDSRPRCSRAGLTYQFPALEHTISPTRWFPGNREPISAPFAQDGRRQVLAANVNGTEIGHSVLPVAQYRPHFRHEPI